MIDYWILAFLALLIGLSAFFSGAETAIISISLTKSRMFVEQNRHGSKALYNLKKSPSRMITTILLGNNLVNIAASAITTDVAIKEFGSIGVGIATGLMIFFILTFGEITPKSYFNMHPERLALFSAKPIQTFGMIILPLVWFFENLSKIILKLFKTDYKPQHLSPDELEAIVETASEQDVISKDTGKMLKAALEFKEISAREVMVPRLKMFVLESNDSIEEALKKLIKSPHSRAPVVRTSRDNIVGVVHIKDLLRDIEDGKGKLKVSNVAKKPVFVSQEERLTSLLKEMQSRRIHMAVVVDEFGGVEGLLTIEDLLEEITGEILDETDLVSNVIRRIDKNTITTHGDTEINYVEQFLNIEIPREADYSTINGLLHYELKDIPNINDKVELEEATLIVEQVNENIPIIVKVIKKIN